MTFVITELYTYPIKSTQGISLQTANVEPRGLQHDRRWMIVDENQRFLTQRQHPKMALISSEIEGTHLTLEAPGMPPLLIDLPSRDVPITVQVWKDSCTALAMGEVAEAWCSEYLGLSCQLVYMPEDAIRPVDSRYQVHPTPPGQESSKDPVSFADGFPFLLISEGSLDDLNQRLDIPVPMNRFRPNLVVRGCDPYAEDQWKRIQVGSVIFHVVKPCARCVLTTIDQTTMATSKEPLQTLARYRKVDGKVMFGQNLIADQVGTIQVGDTVEILETR